MDLPVRLLYKKPTKAILFLEANMEFVDHLFGFLLVPIGRMLKLTGSSNLGAIANVYSSVEKFQSGNMVVAKELLTNPQIPPTYRIATDHSGYRHSQTPRYYVKDDSAQATFVKGGVEYIVTNDLEIFPAPASTTKTLELLRKMKLENIRDLGIAEIAVTPARVQELLRRSLVSNTVLTDIFLGDLKDASSGESL
ncbi:uncharacterized protein LOC9650985 [Selaginella moellendorffii]|uniref:uncharacterized protein LOC9650985 n=1 Tax=Selaginella moellendorffii TaxID=88036 RepID=UPI000D1CFE1E|nr:uncharacterized protein LOC9650985 [Selaginella moellendorffii]|eukprot:XP_024529377.1 uncharacterized protein LOC9650985 [Selaginella moellendorffii]